MAIGVVAAESMAGLICPLTTWENRLRLLAGGEQRYQGSFIQHWLHRVIFFDGDERIFTLAYLTFFLLVALSLGLVPPRRPGASRAPFASANNEARTRTDENAPRSQ